jgi:hypothetical protein
MSRSGFAAGFVVAAVAALALSGCGGSSSPSASSTPTSAPGSSSTPLVSIPAGSSFCTAAAGIGAQLSHAATGLLGGLSPGATPDLAAYKQVIATTTSAIDGFDNAAPSAIASAFHTLRAAYDQANTAVQNATSFQEMSTAFTALSAQAVKDAGTAITAYMTSSCGIVPSP